MTAKLMKESEFLDESKKVLTQGKFSSNYKGK